MKPFLFCLSLIALFTSCELNKEIVKAGMIPTEVRKAFFAAHPNVKKVEWEIEDDGTYEAEFKMDGEEVSANYSATGELLETEVEIKKKALPAAVLAAIAAQFPDHEIEEAARITYPDGRVVYEAELEGADDVKFDAIFSADGTLIERIAPSDDDND